MNESSQLRQQVAAVRETQAATDAAREQATQSRVEPAVEGIVNKDLDAEVLIANAMNRIYGDQVVL